MDLNLTSNYHRSALLVYEVPIYEEEQWVMPEQKSELHIKSRFEKPEEYPERFYVPDDKVSWNSGYKTYNPHYYVSGGVLNNDCTIKPNGWADPENLYLVDRKDVRNSFISTVQFNDRGIPLNPMGRTGIEGRGLLGKWGANFAADPVITRVNPKTKQIEALLIQRVDCGEWAIPGGMVDKGELVTQTLKRELFEETNIQLDFSNAKILFQGYSDDPRNTDNAWMETSLSCLHLTDEEASSFNPEPGDDAKAVRWPVLDQENIGNLFAGHTGFIKRAVQDMLETGQNHLSNDQILALRSLL